MASFPTIYVHGALIHTPVVGDFEHRLAQDPTIRSRFDGGYVQSRARFTRLPETWPLKYAGLSKANKNTLEAFEKTQLAGSNSFTWLNPEDSTNYTVRFVGLASYKAWPHTNFLRWDMEFILEQV